MNKKRERERERERERRGVAYDKKKTKKEIVPVLAVGKVATADLLGNDKRLSTVQDLATEFLRNQSNVDDLAPALLQQPHHHLLQTRHSCQTHTSQ